MVGDFGPFARLIRRLQALPGATPQVVAACAPTVAKLLKDRRGEIEPEKAPGYPPRRFEVSPETADRIAKNTHTWASGSTVKVATVSAEHLRPLYPIRKMPLRWNRALYAKANGEIRRLLDAPPDGGKGDP